MATLNGDNYALQYIDKPSQKIEKGEVAGRKRLVLEHRVLDVVIAANDEILGLNIPANSIVVDAKISISKSLGVTGIFELGHKANSTEAEDSDAFVVAADGGGQAVLKGPIAGAAGIYKRFEEDTQIFVKCTEVTDGAVLDGIITFEVEYVND